ncbi:MAG: TPR end-of-group domain-containing protein [Bacteriovoracaceae bacterium]
MYKKNCENHNYQSCSNLGGIYLSEKKYKTAYPYLLKSCRFNNPTGCYNLSCYYSLNEDIQSSLRKLEKSLLLGIPVDDWLKKDDPDLEFIRKTLEFKVLIKNFSDH